MTRYLLAVGAAVGLAVAASTADRPEKKKPADAKSYDEGAKAFPVGQKMTVTVTKYVPQTVVKTVQMGNQVVTVTETVVVPVTVAEIVVIPERKWTLGVEGWHDKEGFNVETVSADGPLAKVRILDGNKETFRKVEPNDVITKVGDRPIAGEFDLYLAIQSAAAPEQIPIEVISAKDGKPFSGSIAAAKAKK